MMNRGICSRLPLVTALLFVITATVGAIGTDEDIFKADDIETWRTHEGGVSQDPKYIILSDEVRKWNGISFAYE